MSEILGGIVDKARAAITDGIDFLLVIVGVGATASIIEAVRSWFPEQTEGIGDETIGAIIGFLLFYFGDRIHRRLVPLGLGVFLESIGAWSEEYVSQLFAMFKKS